MALRDDGFGLLPVVRVEPSILQAFSCGKPGLDRFLLDSVNLHEDKLGFTTVAFHMDVPGKAVGYFTLSNDGLPLKTSEIEELGLKEAYPLTSFPAVKIGRLAISRDLQRQGVGRQLMGLIHGEIVDSRSLSAARLVVVDAENDASVIAFYKALGYRESLWAENRSKNNASKRDRSFTIKLVRDVLSDPVAF